MPSGEHPRAAKDEPAAFRRRGGRGKGLKPFVLAGLALVAGVAYPFGFAPHGLWPLTLLALFALCHTLNRADARPLLHGWLFGLGKYGCGVYWIYVSIHVYGNATPWLAGSLVALFVAGMAIFHAGGAWAFVRLRRGNAGDAVSFAVVWTLTEWLLTWFLTGFPWLFAGYAMLDAPLAPLVPVGGALLVGFAAALTGAGLALGRFWPAPVLAALPWLAAWLLVDVRWTTVGAAHSVALVQGAVPQNIKWDPAAATAIQARYARLSQPAWSGDLVIWPEAALPMPLHRATAFLEGLAERAQGTLLLGALIGERSPAGWTLHNGAVALGDGAGRYLKRRLVPFGEYVPFDAALRGLIGFFDLPMSRLQPGAPAQPLLRAGELKVAMSICYEIAYAELVRRAAAQADVLATISNDTWFGDSIGPSQHLQIARMRAAENGRYVLRATNDGITAIIAPNGDLVATLPRFEPGVLRGHFHATSGITPFARWGVQLVVAPLLLALALLTAIAIAKRLRRGRRQVRDEPP